MAGAFRRSLGMLGVAIIISIAAATARAAEDGPPLGRYEMEAGNTVTGVFVLESGGKYKYYTLVGALLSAGEYKYDGEVVRWQSGTFKENGYGGTYLIKDGMHIIVMGRTWAYRRDKK